MDKINGFYLEVCFKLTFYIANEKLRKRCKKKSILLRILFLSGWQDSNLRPPAPKAGAITELRYTPNNIASAKIVFYLNNWVTFLKIIFLCAHFWVRDGSGILFLPLECYTLAKKDIAYSPAAWRIMPLAFYLQVA